MGFAGCGVLLFDERPASGCTYGSNVVLRVAVIDETGVSDWTPALLRGIAAYEEAASPHLWFDVTEGIDASSAHIVVRVRRYRDGAPPALNGYTFPRAVGGFAAVYDADGVACNYPPSPLPRKCSGEIATVYIYLNDIIPPGDDIEARRDRLIRHELGHALGLTRHSPDLAIGDLAARYGWTAVPEIGRLAPAP